MRKSVQIVALVAGTYLLAGCQVFQGNSSRLQAGLRIPQQAQPRIYAEQQLEAGRVALTARNYAAAVAAFRNAALEPELAPAAHNGLGVAYAGIGRNDLAERYFREAATAAPGVTRYQDNLVRLLRANFAGEQARMARAAAIRTPSPVATSQTLRGTPFRAALRIEPARARLERLADGAVNLRTTGPASSGALPAVIAARAAEPAQADTPVATAVAKPAEAVVNLAAASEPAPVDPKPEAPKPQSAVIVVADRRGAAPAATPIQPEPVTLSISSTGRRYAAPLEPVVQSAVTFSMPRHTAVASARVTASGLRPRELPQPAFGMVDPETGAERLALAGQ